METHSTMLRRRIRLYRMSFGSHVWITTAFPRGRPMTPPGSDRSIYSSRAPISVATARNWSRLHTSPSAEGRLVSRATKQCSAKRIEPTEYLIHPETLASVRTILDYADRQKLGVPEVLLSLGLNLLTRAGLQAKPYVAEVLREYWEITVDHRLATISLPTSWDSSTSVSFPKGTKTARAPTTRPRSSSTGCSTGSRSPTAKRCSIPVAGAVAFCSSLRPPTRSRSSGRTSTRRPS